MTNRYIGKVSAVQPNYGFIPIGSVVKKDGAPHDLATTADIFIHTMMCSDFSPQDGLEVEFSVEPDTKRGGDALRVSRAHKSTRSRLEALAKGGVELTLQSLSEQGRRVLEHSTVFASWCISPAVLAEVKARRLRGDNVGLLIVHWPVDHHHEALEHRQVVDIMDDLTTIGFRRPGEHRVVSIVVTDRDRDLVDVFLAKGRCDNDYKVTVVARDEAGILLDQHTSLATGFVDVTIPQELFAGPKWDAKWVNLLFGGKAPRDECAYNWRRALAYTVQPILVAIFVIIAGAVAFCASLLAFLAILALLSVGTRGINYRPLNPFGSKVRDVWENVQRPIFIAKFKGISLPIGLAFSPAVLILVSLITWALSGGTPGVEGAGAHWLWRFAENMLVPFVIFGVATVAWYLSNGVNWAARRRARNVQERAREADEIDTLLCPPAGPRVRSLSELPFRPRMIRFYAAAIKQKVCRGFAT